MNNSNKFIVVAEPTLKRLPLYYQYIQSQKKEGKRTISCTKISNDLNLVAVQVRKDLQAAGVIGKPKTGYIIDEVVEILSGFLGYNNTSDVILVGVGNLGKAILGYKNFSECGINIVAAFDSNYEIIGTDVFGIKVFDINKIDDIVSRLHIKIGIITTSKEGAQKIAESMYNSGITSIWNFAPVHIKLPDEVYIQNENLAASLSVLLNKTKLTLV